MCKNKIFLKINQTPINVLEWGMKNELKKLICILTSFPEILPWRRFVFCKIPKATRIFPTRWWKESLLFRSRIICLFSQSEKISQLNPLPRHVFILYPTKFYSLTIHLNDNHLLLHYFFNYTSYVHKLHCNSDINK